MANVYSNLEQNTRVWARRLGAPVPALSGEQLAKKLLGIGFPADKLGSRLAGIRVALHNALVMAGVEADSRHKVADALASAIYMACYVEGTKVAEVFNALAPAGAENFSKIMPIFEKATDARRREKASMMNNVLGKVKRG